MSYLIFLLGIFILLPFKASAICPLCTVVVGSCLWISEWLGIDDAITGLWIGGLTVSMIIWTLTWLDKKNIKFRGRAIITFLIYYLTIIISLYYKRILSQPLTEIGTCLFDKLMIGIIAGSIGFYWGTNLYEYLKERNNGHAYFPYQKVVMPVSSLLILTIIFYFLTN
jgi:hypothetical protein